MAMMRLPQSIARPAPLIRGRYSAAALHRRSNCFHRSAAASHQLAYQTHDMSSCARSLSFCNLLSTNQYYANFTLSRNIDAWELHSTRVRSLSSTTTDGDIKVLNQVRTYTSVHLVWYLLLLTNTTYRIIYTLDSKLYPLQIREILQKLSNY